MSFFSNDDKQSIRVNLSLLDSEDEFNLFSEIIDLKVSGNSVEMTEDNGLLQVSVNKEDSVGTN